ncbi:unnamed protein product [Adineta ricciae]|uniref:Uncharacterized protein n=1 Tax=Adineta ricciae TaxID=249248 RepID=A0A815VHK3_ADIRI|nr:unnamed protein product [Adineta ricciae]
MAIDPLEQVVQLIDEIDAFELAFREKGEKQEKITNDEIDKFKANVISRPLHVKHQEQLREERNARHIAPY